MNTAQADTVTGALELQSGTEARSDPLLEPPPRSWTVRPCVGQTSTSSFLHPGHETGILIHDNAETPEGHDDGGF